MLRSASGRAFLAYCQPRERATVLQRLRARNGRSDELAHDPNAIRQLVESTRHQGYATRVADFGGDFERPRAEMGTAMLRMRRRPRRAVRSQAGEQRSEDRYRVGRPLTLIELMVSRRSGRGTGSEA